MLTVEKKKINKEECLNFCSDKRYLGHYKYFIEVVLHDSDFDEYKKWLRRCEKLGFEFILVFVETGEKYNLLCGFTNFNVISINNSAATDLFSHRKSFENIAEEYFAYWQECCNYYLISSNLKKYLKTEELR